MAMSQQLKAERAAARKAAREVRKAERVEERHIKEGIRREERQESREALHAYKQIHRADIREAHKKNPHPSGLTREKIALGVSATLKHDKREITARREARTHRRNRH